MNCSKEKQSVTFGASFVFAGSLIITLLGITPLYAGNQTIQQYKQSGNYVTALKIARNS